MEARPCAGETNQDIVAGAWDFREINARYAAYCSVLNQRPRTRLNGESDAVALKRWANEERYLWHDAFSIDPLLPVELLPKDYLGRQAWDGRIEALREAAEQIASFSLSFALQEHA